MNASEQRIANDVAEKAKLNVILEKGARLLRDHNMVDHYVILSRRPNGSFESAGFTQYSDIAHLLFEAVKGDKYCVRFEHGTNVPVSVFDV